MTKWKAVGGACAVLGFLMMVGFVSKQQVPQGDSQKLTAQDAKAGKNAAHDRALMRAARLAVLASARDPDSVKFDGLMHVVRPGEIVCGKVNARNGFGGYTGFRAFIYDHGMLFTEEHNGKTFQEDWNARCAGK